MKERNVQSARHFRETKQRTEGPVVHILTFLGKKSCFLVSRKQAGVQHPFGGSAGLLAVARRLLELLDEERRRRRDHVDLTQRRGPACTKRWQAKEQGSGGRPA